MKDTLMNLGAGITSISTIQSIPTPDNNLQNILSALVALATIIFQYRNDKRSRRKSHKPTEQ
ncbi:MAG: hypothetical protein V4613_03595 [Bacteroidota bacterium]